MGDRQIDLEREIACDDMVAGSPEEARSYADCLTRAVALCGGVRTSLAAANVADRRSHLSRRVELLVDKDNIPAGLLTSRLALIAIALMGAAGLLAKTPSLVSFTAPRVTNLRLMPVQIDAPMPAPPPALMSQLAKPIPAAAQTNFDQQMKLGNDQMKDRHFDQAIATYQSIMPEAPDDKSKGLLWSHIGECYRYKGNFADSIHAVEQAAALLPNDAAIASSLGLLYDAQHDFVNARKYYERALAIDPNNPLLLNNLAYMLTETGGDLDQALNYARMAQAKLPNFIEVEDTIGWIYLKKNMPSIAAPEFWKAVQKAPQNPEYHYHYAMALNQQGLRADAMNELRTALKNNPKPEMVKDIRGMIDQSRRYRTRRQQICGY